MYSLFLLWFGVLIRLFRSRGKLVLENLALRQQLAVLKRRHLRPRLDLFDKLFWVMAHQFWSTWKEALLVVTPETVVRWRRAGFRLYWRLISKVRAHGGRRPTLKEVRELVFRMVAENPTWGAPRIHGELLVLGFDVSERTISRWMRRAPRDPQPAKRWLAFLRNHREAISGRVEGFCSRCGEKESRHFDPDKILAKHKISQEKFLRNEVNGVRADRRTASSSQRKNISHHARYLGCVRHASVMLGCSVPSRCQNPEKKLPLTKSAA